jgi:hydroxypyruvate isomerase
MQVMEGDIIATIRQNHALIAHYHTAGVPGRHEIDETQELNYPPILRAIQETGYQGFIGQEFVPLGDPVEAYRKAYQLCSI